MITKPIQQPRVNASKAFTNTRKVLFNYLKVFLLLLLFVRANAQHPQVNGYRGIWFTLGQFSEYGDKYSGGLGTYTSSHIPIAVYSKQVDKTFFVYGGTTAQNEKHLLIMISYYDHKKGMVPKPVIVYDKEGVDDPHDNASLSIDENGYIWIFVSGRNTTRPGIIFKSHQPYQIDNFEKIRDGEMTYPQPWWMKGKGFIYLFTKYTKGRELYWSTSKDGRTWEIDQKLAGMGGHYQVSNVWNGKLVTVFNYHPDGNVDKRTNIYLVQTTDMGKTWNTIDGKKIQPPLSDIHCESLVKDYAKEGSLVYLNDLNFDKNGNPVILAVVSKGFQPGPKGNPREWTVITWKDAKWNFQKVCESTHNYDMGSLYIDGNHWQIIGPTDPGPQLYGTGGEMVLWASSNEGKTWKKTTVLTSNSTRNHSYARRPLDAHEDFYSFWADGNADTFSESKLYFTNKTGSKVLMLPYDMEKDFEKPAELKKETNSK
jgi:BNR repeat-containing family member